MLILNKSLIFFFKKIKIFYIEIFSFLLIITLKIKINKTFLFPLFFFNKNKKFFFFIVLV